MIYIIGSGLSAMATASALVKRGCKPTILDAGITPQPSILDLKERLASVEPEQWEQEDLSHIKNIGPQAVNGIPRKLYFGSNFAFGEMEWAPAMDISQASMHRSFAMGGFSNVWGAVIRALPANEIREWPVTCEELAPHYSAVRTLMNLTQCFSPLRPSSQAAALYQDFCSHRTELKRAGIAMEHPQLAVHQTDQNEQNGCRYCGLCLYGCPYESRYRSATTLQKFTKEGRLIYKPGVWVDRVVPEKGCIRIEARSVANGAVCSFKGERVFLAAGLVESSRIILASLNLYDIPIPVKSSDIFTLPLLRYRASAEAKNERLHTLCQLVARIEDEAVCRYPIYLQLYGYNDLYQRLMIQRMGFWAHPFMPVLRALASRLFVIFGYLHSRVSAKITLTMARNGNHKLILQGQPSLQALRIGRLVAQKLFEKRKALRAMPLSFQLRLDLPGGSYHCGGVFPMRRSPGTLETDTLGRLPSLPRVHITDASIIPSIPASPMSFTIMANAHRIASEIENISAV